MEKLIFGKNLTPEKEVIWKNAAEKSAEKGKELIEEEIEKTPEDLKAIEKINSFLAREAEAVGAKKIIPVAPEQIHYLPEKSYDKHFQEQAEKGTAAFYSPGTRAIYINADAHPDRPKKYHATIHEMTHSAAAHVLRVKEKSEKTKARSQKCGYGVVYFQEEKEEEEKYRKLFGGFNEAVTEKITREAIFKNKEKIQKEFNFSEKEISSAQKIFQDIYADYVAILDAIIKKMSEKTGRTENDVWDKIKKGYFDGEVMHLREIERVCGAGSLRLIDAMGKSKYLKFAPREELSDLIQLYFQTDNEKTKKDIMELVLK